MEKTLPAPGSVLGPVWWSQEVCFREAEMEGRTVAVEQVFEVGTHPLLILCV